MAPYAAADDCIGFITAGYGGFWDKVSQGAQNAGEELKNKVIILRSKDEADINAQIRIMQSMINHGCKVLVLAPNSHKSLLYVERYKKFGIPTLYVDRDMGGKSVGVIKTDNYLAGKTAGAERIKALGGKGKIALLRLSPGVVSTTKREDGFIDTVKAAGLDIEVDEYLGKTIGEAKRTSLKILKNMDGIDGIDGIFTPNEATSLAVLSILKQMGKAGEITHIGFDAHELMIKALKEKQIYGFIAQQPFLMGYKSVDAAYDVLKGKKFKNDISIDTIFINNQNINNDEIKKLLGLK